CDVNNYYYQSGSDSATGTNYCKYKNYVDTSNTCNGAGSCTAGSCSSSSTSTQATAGICKYISSCSGSSAGSVSNYGSGTSCSGTTDCDVNNYYYRSGTDSATTTSYCKYRDYADTSNTCNGAGSCTAGSCSSSSTSTQATAGTCKYIGSCFSGTAGTVSNYGSGISCGTGKMCNGAGSCLAVNVACSTSTVYWSQFGISCSASASGTSHGNYRNVYDNSGIDTGSARATCNNGNWVMSNKYCEDEFACFMPNELISTPTGKVPIRELKEGDVIVSFDDVTGEITTSIIGDIIVHDGVDSFVHDFATFSLVNLTINVSGELVDTHVTMNHPYYDPIEKEYKKLRDFDIGAEIFVFNGTGFIVSRVDLINEKSSYDKRQTVVYNLHMSDGPHNYFVDDVLVHNAINK
ncbi:MAG: hypothetical protein HRU03_04445, partial [Nanoarchaeales archaeon]|nr:hypothetical protein [Nanoarchaeales archaeon]